MVVYWLLVLLTVACFIHLMWYVAQSKAGEPRRIPTIVGAYLVVGSMLWWLLTLAVASVKHWETTNRAVDALIKVGLFIALTGGVVGSFGRRRYIASLWLAVLGALLWWWGSTLP